MGNTSIYCFCVTLACTLAICIGLSSFDNILAPACEESETQCHFQLRVEYMSTMVYVDEATNFGNVVVERDGKLYKRTLPAIDCGSIEELTDEESEKVLYGDGGHRVVFAINNQFPGPSIVAYEGTELIIHFENGLRNELVTIHWHGVPMEETPWMDGVQDINQCGIRPEEAFTYRFTPKKAGTYWYHAHVGEVRQDGLFGALIILERTPDVTHVNYLTNVVPDGVDPEVAEEFVLHIQDFYPKLSPSKTLEKDLKIYGLLDYNNLEECLSHAVTSSTSVSHPDAFYSALINGKAKKDLDTQLKALTKPQGTCKQKKDTVPKTKALDLKRKAMQEEAMQQLQLVKKKRTDIIPPTQKAPKDYESEKEIGPSPSELTAIPIAQSDDSLADISGLSSIMTNYDDQGAASVANIVMASCSTPKQSTSKSSKMNDDDDDDDYHNKKAIGSVTEEELFEWMKIKFDKVYEGRIAKLEAKMERRKKEIRDLQNKLKTEVSMATSNVEDCSESFYGGHTSLEIKKFIKDYSDFQVCVKDLFLFVFGEEYIRTHSILGQKPNSTCAAKDGFDLKTLNLCFSIINEKFSVSRAEIKKKLENLQKSLRLKYTKQSSLLGC